MLDFRVDQQLCVKCGRCVADCPTRIISLAPYPVIKDEANCLRCQHCLAVCPTGAVSILGVTPHDVLPLEGSLPSAAQVGALLRGRRSVRSYKQENVDAATMATVLDNAWHAPTGVNARQVHIHLVDSLEMADHIRNEVYELLGQEVAAGRLSAASDREFLGKSPELWKKKRVDIVFRGAPHFLVTSVPKTAPCSTADGHIFVAYFELAAQAQGLGTVWSGMIMHCLHLLPKFRELLGIPRDHNLGYAMSFGKPAVLYHRTVNHGPARVLRKQLPTVTG